MSQALYEVKQEIKQNKEAAVFDENNLPSSTKP